jgi:hypothetical protein
VTAAAFSAARFGILCASNSDVVPIPATEEYLRMPRTKIDDAKKHGDPLQPLIDRTGERSSPGSGEDEDEGDEAADLQPDDVEEGDTAR